MFSHSIKLTNQHITNALMAHYNFKNPQNALKIGKATFWTYDALKELDTSLGKTNVTVVGSLRDMKAALTTFLSAGEPGHPKRFEANRRWEGSDQLFANVLYYTNYDGKIREWVANLELALDNRTSSSTREEANKTAGKGKDTSGDEDRGEDASRALKQVGELRKQLSGFFFDETLQWDQGRFETRAPAEWVAGTARTST